MVVFSVDKGSCPSRDEKPLGYLGTRQGRVYRFWREIRSNIKDMVMILRPIRDGISQLEGDTTLWPISEVLLHVVKVGSIGDGNAAADSR